MNGWISNWFRVPSALVSASVRSHQALPAVAIDADGGVNLVFYDNRNDPSLVDSDDWLDVYYLRITGFGTSAPTLYQQRLTPASFKLEPVGFLGDYHNMALAGPNGTTMYTAYAVREQDTGGPWTEQNCYVRKITLP